MPAASLWMVYSLSVMPKAVFTSSSSASVNPVHFFPSASSRPVDKRVQSRSAEPWQINVTILPPS